MDIFAHAVYGATVCSKTGLAGGRIGNSGRHWIRDWTVWCAGLFGILPDVVSMGLPFLVFWHGGGGADGNFFRELSDNDIVAYRYMHSLIVSLAAVCILRFAWKPIFIASLAWPLHVAMDALTHGAGKFQTTVFYPLSTWSPEGIRWWQHPELMLGYWLMLPVIWLLLWGWRRGKQ